MKDFPNDYGQRFHVKKKCNFFVGFLLDLSKLYSLFFFGCVKFFIDVKNHRDLDVLYLNFAIFIHYCEEVGQYYFH